MQGKDAHNLDAGFRAPLQSDDTTPRTAPPPYTDVPPQPGYPGQGPAGYPHLGPQAGGYPHPSPQGGAGYPQPAPAPQGPTVYPSAPATAVVTGPTVIVQTVVGPESTRTTCRNCNHQISTRIDRKSTMKTHLMAMLLCVLGCWCCVCIPYCMDSCLDVDHYCPNCNAFIGAYKN